MTPQELKTIRKSLGLTQRGLGFWLSPKAKDMGRSIRRWETGERTIPDQTAVTMKMFEDGAMPVHIK